jgi:hypothetical protein
MGGWKFDYGYYKAPWPPSLGGLESVLGGIWDWRGVGIVGAIVIRKCDRFLTN